MGNLHYGGHQFALDDRVLAHLQIVITQKLRRSEAFFINWDDPIGEGRQSIWIDNGMPIWVEFVGKPPAINRVWLETLIISAGGTTGLHLTEEPVEDPAA